LAFIKKWLFIGQAAVIVGDNILNPVVGILYTSGYGTQYKGHNPGKQNNRRRIFPLYFNILINFTNRKALFGTAHALCSAKSGVSQELSQSLFANLLIGYRN
jgi:hypothetical protein